MSDEIHIELGERLNLNATKFPPAGPVIEFLKELFTEEEAEIAAEFPIDAHTLDVLADHYGGDLKELESKLESMADNFLIFVSRNNDGAKELHGNRTQIIDVHISQ